MLKRLSAVLRAIARGAADALFPRGANCLLCGAPHGVSVRTSLCRECAEALSRLFIRDGVCVRCMSPVTAGKPCAFCRAGGRKGLDAMYAAFVHRDAARGLVMALKYQYVNEAATALADGMADAFPAHAYDCLVPVPLHRLRLRVRGANQARILCDEVSARTGLPVLEALTRVRETKTQTRLSAKERRLNVEDAFVADDSVRGRRVLLVDDVRTTGATARSCAKTLRRAGAARVALLTATVAGGNQTKRGKNDEHV